MRIYINTIILLFATTYLHSQDWSMTITAEDIEETGASDYIILQMCDGCHDDFHFGEDEYDLPTPPDYYTDISFTNFEWVGTFDDNGNECTNPEFYIDKKSFHDPADLLKWNIGGFTNLNNDSSIELTWDFEELSDEYELFLYFEDMGYNMRTQNNLIISQSQLSINYDSETGVFNSNIKVLIGGCAEEGTTTYYYDSDGDGYGGNFENSEEFCAGLEPDGWVSNNDDVNDDFYCQENIIDLCNVCNGLNECLDCNNEPWGDAEIDDCGICGGNNANQDCWGECFGTAEIDDCGICSGGNTYHIADSDMDCSGTCFGSAEIDDCGICDDFNQSCLTEIFLDGPIQINAYINNNMVELSWNQINYPENQAILGFNIYRNENYLASTVNEQFLVEEFNDGEFCIAAFDQYNNESTLNCGTATDMQEFCWVLDHGLNLISYPILPVDVTVENIFSSLADYIVGIISEGDTASLLPNGIWVGSLTVLKITGLIGSN